MGETVAMILTNFIGIAVCLPFGLLWRIGKGHSLMGGYNTMSEKEKSKWNILALGKFMGNMLVLASAILLVACLPILLNFYPSVFILVSWILFIVILISGGIYVNISSKFKNKE
ncbi:MAG: DUF3784 domain-containing protein [Defluviitaleaceae bacterium]|nr:DUF3784 domain-containing protein [Defluviitaleaceae bacterium]